MYVFGNFDMFSSGSELWKNVVNEAKEANELGSRLLLGCHMHQNITEIQTPEDFKNKSPTGGCRLPCKKKLNCGHICKMLCHNKDVEHKEYKCTEKCTKIFQPCNHPCPDMCHQECQKCLVQTLIQLSCGHTQLVHCYQTHTEEDIAEIQCLQPCPKILACGHQCSELYVGLLGL
ncbi:ZNFX1 [Bugula neritina]|uniref:ZNFX1 n=1 Tax=Bugula neritina TaxID=10212 RepID=A0A7J7J6T0_BUGNE|nr:ZNFX1 [Bugula neritina]